jgi:hypothetical protein
VEIEGLLAGFGALGGAVIAVNLIILVFVILIQILIIREGIRSGLRAHQLWLEKTRRVAMPLGAPIAGTVAPPTAWALSQDPPADRSF